MKLLYQSKVNIKNANIASKFESFNLIRLKLRLET
jgi:hypothetical protein